ncbi:MAG: MarR family transcriptional regulator [Candidatus Marinimicrobia bacterium]|jgi:DNA-binding MarR family transcriptional regulator|nr:MarR family transcriptional regulator [Candidatus Neomarinimicrobiota bacterium]MDG2366298.1 MarR family transcriptional regulator [Candidatus Neomarinimicrobiota bacterium]|tara:strand:+ start:11789 stop:12211 length:423 start_codon:yes stop_codon:yes gene_type:complete
MEFGELLKQFLIDLQSLFRTSTKKLNLTLPQITLLSSIPIDGIDMSTLSKRIGVDNSTLTRLIDILIKNNFVRKIKNPKDGRSFIILLTVSGEKLQFKIEQQIDQFGSKIFSKIPIEDQDEVKETLSTLHWLISKHRLNS